MQFGEALDLVRNGGLITRTGWNGKNMWVQMQVPDEFSKMGRPYLYMRPVEGKLVPWVASQSDILADDWEPFIFGRESATTPNPHDAEEQLRPLLGKLFDAKIEYGRFGEQNEQTREYIVAQGDVMDECFKMLGLTHLL